MSKIGLLASYRADVAAGKISEDAEQVRIVGELERLSAELDLAARRESSLLGQLRRRVGRKSENSCKGLYLWGGVGRGKTYLLDLFFY